MEDVAVDAETAAEEEEEDEIEEEEVERKLFLID